MVYWMKEYLLAGIGKSPFGCTLNTLKKEKHHYSNNRGIFAILNFIDDI